MQQLEKNNINQDEIKIRRTTSNPWQSQNISTLVFQSVVSDFSLYKLIQKISVKKNNQIKNPNLKIFHLIDSSSKIWILFCCMCLCFKRERRREENIRFHVAVCFSVTRLCVCYKLIITYAYLLNYYKFQFSAGFIIVTLT